MESGMEPDAVGAGVREPAVVLRQATLSIYKTLRDSGVRVDQWSGRVDVAAFNELLDLLLTRFTHLAARPLEPARPHLSRSFLLANMDGSLPDASPSSYLLPAESVSSVGVPNRPTETQYKASVNARVSELDKENMELRKAVADLERQIHVARENRNGMDVLLRQALERKDQLAQEVEEKEADLAITRDEIARLRLAAVGDGQAEMEERESGYRRRIEELSAAVQKQADVVGKAKAEALARISRLRAENQELKDRLAETLRITPLTSTPPRSSTPIRASRRPTPSAPSTPSTPGGGGLMVSPRGSRSTPFTSRETAAAWETARSGIFPASPPHSPALPDNSADLSALLIDSPTPDSGPTLLRFSCTDIRVRLNLPQ